MDRGNEQVGGFGGPIDRIERMVEKAVADLVPPTTEAMTSGKETSDKVGAMIDAIRAGRLKITISVFKIPITISIPAF